MPDVELKDSGDANPMESGGSAQVDNAELTGQNYEQITSALKAKDTGAAKDESSTESTAAATAQAEGEDDLRLMTDEEIQALPQELQREAKALKKKLLGAYTRKTQGLAEIRRRAEFADRFENDPDFRSQVIRQHGFQPAQTQQGQPPQTGQVQVPPQYVELRKRTLPTELQWMAESLALGDYQRDVAIYRGYIEPLQKDRETSKRETATREYQAAESRFAEENPGWDAHEDDMVEVLEFLKGQDLTHPRWGSKLSLLYRLATGEQGEAKTVQKALERTAQAVKSQSVTGGGGRGATPNVEDRVRKAPNDSEAWALAKAAAKGAR